MGLFSPAGGSTERYGRSRVVTSTPYPAAGVGTYLAVLTVSFFVRRFGLQPGVGSLWSYVSCRRQLCHRCSIREEYLMRVRL